MQTAWWCPFHVILVQEAELHSHEMATSAEKQFHVYQGADLLILFQENTFKPDGPKIPGLFNARRMWLDILVNQVKVQEAALEREQHVHSCLSASAQHDVEEAPLCKATVGPVQERHRAKICRHHCRRLPHLGHLRTRKHKGELDRRKVGRLASDTSARLGSNVGPDGGLMGVAAAPR